MLLNYLVLNNLFRCTIILVAHRLSTVINADQIFVVDRGTIAERVRINDVVVD